PGKSCPIEPKLLQEIEFHHKEVVPREELEKVSKKYEGLCHLHKKVSHAHDLLKNKYDKLIGNLIFALLRKRMVRELILIRVWW
ncbi:hypothetical protein Avbf_16552, partial [Armadillidium vulgare]